MLFRHKLGLANVVALLGVLPLSLWTFGVSQIALMQLLSARREDFSVGFSNLLLVLATMIFGYGIAAVIALPARLYASRLLRANIGFSGRSARVVQVLVNVAAFAPLAAMALFGIAVWRQATLAS